MNKHQIRLDLIAPELLSRLEKATSQQLRLIANSICVLVVERSGLENPIVAEVMDSLKSGAPRQNYFRSNLLNLVESLDEDQWNLQELVDRGQAKKSAQHSAFISARAANALFYALDDDPLFSAAEVIYEANAALDDLQIIETLASLILENE